MHARQQAKGGLNPNASLLGFLQRRCACGKPTPSGGECEECRKKGQDLQRQTAHRAEAVSVPPIIHDVLGSPGHAMDRETRTFMDSRFGHDFSHVRLHTDARAAASARSVNALAYTAGHHIVFGARQYAPKAAAGRNLLAHELVHVLQQGSRPSTLQPRLQIAPAKDPAEAEADRLARRALSGSPSPGSGSIRPSRRPPLLRRRRTGPQGIGENDKRMVTLPEQTRGNDQVRIHVFRTLVACPCRRVDEARDGVFYNPDLDNLVISYHYCRGGTSVDTYAQLESNARAFLGGTAPPAGTARVGIDVNVVGRNVGGRVVLEALGTNQGSGPGVGGRAQVVFQGGRWRVFLDSQFIRRLQSLGTVTPNQLQLSLGGQFGNVTFRADFNDLLEPTLRGARGTICIPAGGVDICPFFSASSSTGFTGGVGINIPLGIPETREEICRQCLCPPAGRRYECIEDVLPRDEQVTEDVPIEVSEEFRYYFRLDRTTPSEDSELRAQSTRNLSALQSRVTAGDRVVSIWGYASPEATERHNQNLAQRRAERLLELVRSRVGPDVTLPRAEGLGELLGRRPTPSPSSRLGEVVRDSGFRSADEVTALLLGEEIPRAELQEQFVSLFQALPDPHDRLAVFGLGPEAAIAQQVLSAIERFLRSRAGSHRPWERVFRLLRMAVARVTRTETRQQTRTVRHRGSVRALPRAECEPFSRQAEDAGLFPRIAEEARRPRTSSTDRNDDCLLEPQRGDREMGCDYTIPSNLRQPARAPGRAPRRLR